MAILGFGQWWLFWPWIVWSFAFAVHFLLVRSLNVSSDWVEERTAFTSDKAYDFDHIDNIRERYDEKLAQAGKSSSKRDADPPSQNVPEKKP